MQMPFAIEIASGHAMGAFVTARLRCQTGWSGPEGKYPGTAQPTGTRRDGAGQRACIFFSSFFFFIFLDFEREREGT